jgi:hypothetical protein
MKRFVVVRSLARRYGYSIQAPPGITWAIGPGRTVGWYRRKCDALKRADELNRLPVKEER